MIHALKKPMRIAFRVDSSLDIGTGHVMRCLTLAEALRAQRAECHFICREHSGNQLGYIRQRGFPATALPYVETCNNGEEIAGFTRPTHAPWLGADWKTDASQTGDALAMLKPDWLAVDHYALDARWETALRGHYARLLVIDDLADRPHDCDLLLDQNLGRKAEDYAHLAPRHCKVLAGSQYALLRSEFAALREYSLRRREYAPVKNILVSMGGVDQPNATGQVLEALKLCRLPADCRITVVMGGQAPWLSQLQEVARTMTWPTEVRADISDMAQVMADSDLSIGAAGSTSWERCCLGLPALLVVLAENQREAAKALEQERAVIMLNLGNDLSARLSEQLIGIIKSPDIAHDMMKNASAAIDGLGTSRVVAEILNMTANSN